MTGPGRRAGPLAALAADAIAWYRGSGGGRRWFGVACNFEPSCSAYAETAIRRFGLRRGARLALRRLRACTARDSVCRCIDPVPAETAPGRARS